MMKEEYIWFYMDVGYKCGRYESTLSKTVPLPIYVMAQLRVDVLRQLWNTTCQVLTLVWSSAVSKQDML